MPTMRTVIGIVSLMSVLAYACSQSTSFTYQGLLKRDGELVNGNYDFQFSLWTAASGGTQVGTTRTVTNVAVQNGLFTVTLDFGAVWYGDDRYLQIAVRPAGSGSYTTLLPRVKISSTPYAIHALSVPWSGISGIPTGFADGVDNDTTYLAGAGLQLVGTTFSIATGGVWTSMLADGAVTSVKIADGTVGTVDLANGAVTDTKLSNTGVTPGTYGSATQVGVFTVNAQGRITSASNVPISGVPPGGTAGGDLSGTYPNPTVAKLQGYPISSVSPSNNQVLKWNGSMWAPASDGLTLPFSGSASANAVFTITNTATSGHVYGVFGMTHSTNGGALLGITLATTGYTHGVIGKSYSTNGRGVFGWAVATTGDTVGVFGESDSANGWGVYGWATATSGSAIGVQGETDSPGGAGVYGRADAPNGASYGVYGESASIAGTGVFGYAAANSGTTYGVRGKVNSPSGWAGYFEGRGYFSGDLLVAGSLISAAGGDLSGSYPNPTVVKIQNRPVSSTSPSPGQVLKWNGSQWAPAPDEIGSATSYWSTNGNHIYNNNTGNVGIGTTTPAAKLDVNGTARVRVLEIVGADLAEKFPTTETLEPGMVVEIDPDNPGHLRKARGAYNKRVAGVVAGANGLSKGIILGNLEGSENHTAIAISGRVWVYADATHEAIEPGDLLTTSDTPGHAMKASDPSRAHGAVLGKAMTRLEKGKTGMVLVLVNLQ